VLGVVVDLAERSAVAPERLAEPEQVLPAGVPSDLVALAQWLAHEYCSTPARALALVLVPGAAGGVRSRQVLVAELTHAGRDAVAGGQTLTSRQRDTLAQLANAGPAPAAQLGTAALRRLQARGLVTMYRAPLRRRPARHDVSRATATAPTLTGEQARALRRVLEALAGPRTPGRSQRFLLQGVTGSGKTEVYLQAVQAALASGTGAIVLVPEIALTPQALQRFEARFGDIVAILHSGLGAGERHDEWMRLARGEARVCVGPRSAVFAPLPAIGLIVVDEEHEGSYKHDRDPRYDARSVAEWRARQHGAVLMLGSATPRPESAATIAPLRLQSRVDRRPLPSVEVLDMRGQHHPLHPHTRVALADVRRARSKAIVLLNRRGWSNFFSCRACGRVWMCPNCEVALVFHRAQAAVACHHCGHREPVPGRCPACASVSVARHGAGTERIEHELGEALGDDEFPVLRLDADSTGVGQRARTLERFRSAPAGLLVGTQMVAKGHDFPDVELGVVIDADQTLRFPDFRAEERTFALITQLAGRTGRGGGVLGAQSTGRVLVQTLAPDARAIRFAAGHDADGFLAGELLAREALGYPPFSSLIRIVCSAPQADAATGASAALRAAIDAPGAIVLGPAPLFALRGRARSQLVIKATDRAAAIAAVDEAVQRWVQARGGRDVNVSVDVDPQ
jgi:primosomal protein N' (replication factor Y)